MSVTPKHLNNIKFDQIKRFYVTHGKVSHNDDRCNLQFEYDKKDLYVYFEITIKTSQATNPVLAIGFAPDDPKKWQRRGMVGWADGAVGFHGDVGAIYDDSTTAEPYLEKFAVGDTVGAFWGLASSKVFFTKNGKKLTTYRGCRSHQQVGFLLPTITCQSGQNIEFSLNINEQDEKFKYNLSKDMIVDESKPLTRLEVNESSKIGDDLVKAFNQQTDSDLVFTFSSGEKLFAHKVVVRNRSSVIADLLKQDVKSIEVPSKFKVDVFKLILQFLYSGKAVLVEENWEAVLKCSDFYGVTDLRKACFEFMVKKLSKDTVLDMMSKAQRGEFEFDSSDLIKRCVVFMEKKAHEIIKTDGFLDLSENVIILMLKNTNTCADELDLVKACARWAEYQKKKTGKEVKELLKNISRHIRYPLLSPQELVKEVKPLGIIPQDLYLQAVEYHAFPGKFDNSKDEQFVKRFRTFQGTGIIDERMAAQLLLWLPKSEKGWECLYKATKDGFSNATFHQKCDNKGPTVVIIKSKGNGYVFGGYTPVPWAGVGSYSYDTRTFLFSLKNQDGTPVKIGNNTNNRHSTYNSSGYGPTFGGGHDLYICDGSNNSNSSYSNLGYSFKLPKYQYSTNQIKSFLAGGYNFTCEEIEVFGKAK